MDPRMSEAFRAIPYGVYVLTTGRGDGVSAMIVSWVSQVSYEPPLLLAALRHTRRALPEIRKNGFFSLSLLRAGQVSLVSSLKRNPAAQALPLVDSVEGGAPFIEGALACFACRVFSIFETGDHVSVNGEVLCTLKSPGENALTTPEYGKTYIGQS